MIDDTFDSVLSAVSACAKSRAEQEIELVELYVFEKLKLGRTGLGFSINEQLREAYIKRSQEYARGRLLNALVELAYKAP